MLNYILNPNFTYVKTIIYTFNTVYIQYNYFFIANI